MRELQIMKEHHCSVKKMFERLAARVDEWLPSYIEPAFFLKKMEFKCFQKVGQKFLMYIIMISPSVKKFNLKLIVF
jgi:hypothetical protein